MSQIAARTKKDSEMWRVDKPLINSAKSLFMLELDGFLCVAFGIFDFYCLRFIVTVYLYAQYGFFQWLAIVIM